MEKGRRAFVSGSGLVLAGVAAGTVTGLSSSAASDAANSQAGPKFAGFGWEVTNLDNNGADVYFHVRSSMILNFAGFDNAFMITSPPGKNAGFAEVLCRAAVTHGVPKFVKGDAGAPFVSPESPNFGKVQVYNPNDLNVGNDGYLLENIFYNIILKTWVPPNGTASSTSRHVSLAPLLRLNVDDYLVFHMNHAGVPGDAEMQVVLQYTLT